MVYTVDNVIAEGRLEPAVVVRPNGQERDWDRPRTLEVLIDYILPHMVENHNLSEDRGQRAFSGLSKGGVTVIYSFFRNTDVSQYFLAMSPPMLEDVDPDYTIENLSAKRRWFGLGMYDLFKLRRFVASLPAATTNPYSFRSRRPEGSMYEDQFPAEIGVPFTNIELPFGHVWVLWRMTIVDAFDNVLWQ